MGWGSGWSHFSRNWQSWQVSAAERSAGEIPDEEWASLSQQLGYDAKQAYVDMARRELESGQLAGPPSPELGYVPPIGARQWVAQQKRAIHGEFAPVLDVYSSYYSELTGKPIPPDLMATLQAKLNDPNLPYELKQTLRDAIITYESGPPTGAKPTSKAYGNWLKAKRDALGQIMDTPFLQTAIKEYMKVHPTVDKTQAMLDEQVTSQFIGTLGRAPTADELKQLRNADDITVKRYIDNQPSHLKGLNYGMYKATVDRMTPEWERYFHRLPTDAELLTGAGWTPEQQQDFIDNSPSSVKGVTIGRYRALDDFVHKINDSLFPGGSIDPSLIEQVHKGTL